MIWDISPLVTSELAVFPGDISYTRIESMSFNQGQHLSLSSIQTTLHLGSHADAPSHYHPEGRCIDEQDLAIYLGPCQVVDVSRCGPRGITVADLVDKHIESPRILFKTNSILSMHNWQVDFTYLLSETIQYLADNKVILVGIDTPSMDHSKSQSLDGHKSFYVHDMAILEGLVLQDVPEGFYYLSALPLKLRGAEAAPVRAVLFDQDALTRSFSK